MVNFESRNAYFDKLCNTPGLMWLGQNTNHFEPHPSVRQAILDVLHRGEYHAYAPPAGFEELRELIKADMGMPDASVLVTDGAVEALYNVCRNTCEPATEMVTTDPSWSWPIHFAHKAGASVTELPIYDPAQGYKLTIQQLRATVTPKTRMIYLVDPNNPLGTCHSETEIQEIAEVARSVGAYLVQDATYCHFAEKFSPAFKHYPERTILIYSFSKWLGFAGLRLGAILASPQNIEIMANAPPNNLGSNVLSQRGAIAGLKSKSEWFPEIWRRQRRNQAEVAKAVSRIEGFTVPVYPSQANLLIVETVTSGIKPEALVLAFRDEGIMIRQGSYHSKRFGSRFVKISLTVPEEWADSFCELFPRMAEKARTLEVPTELF